jgi:dUTP pyrophosphatase
MSGVDESYNNNDKYANEFYVETNYRNYAVLKLWVNPANTKLVELYEKHIADHNAKNRNTAFPNAGFDLFIPKTESLYYEHDSHFIDLEVKAEMIFVDLALKSAHDILRLSKGVVSDEITNVGGVCYNTGYYMFPRSSISKTPLLMSNHTGIIDSGYRGNLIAAVRYLHNGTTSYRVEPHTRLFQICHPQLCPIFVVMVTESELTETSRGTGGFGSTGIIGLAQSRDVV